jgi:predicted deacylase
MSMLASGDIYIISGINLTNMIKKIRGKPKEININRCKLPKNGVNI